MRTIFLTLAFLIAIAVPCLAEDTPEEAVSVAESVETETVEIQTPDGTVEETETEVVEEIVTDPDFMVGPFGSLMLMDGTTYEIAELEKISKYYVYITGKLNGRSSTVISLTRLKDLRHWNQIGFHDPSNFKIFTNEGKELIFTDARIYFGSPSSDSFTFIINNPMSYQEEPMEFKKVK